jgi:hypothetical protein
MLRITPSLASGEKFLVTYLLMLLHDHIAVDRVAGIKRAQSDCENLSRITRSMKRIAFLLGLFVPFFQLHGAEIEDLVLPGEAFGKGWELTQRNIIGSAAAPNYVNRARTDQPVIMVNVIAFPSAQIAKESLERKVGGPGASRYVKKLGAQPTAYEQINGNHRKRYVLIQNYWLTVEQIGQQDDRNIFI